MEEWLTNNNLYLEASLQWLRLRLQKLVPHDEPLPTTPATPADVRNTSRSSLRDRFSRWKDPSVTAPREVLLLPAGNAPSLDDQIAEAAAAREAAAGMEPPPALLLLAQRFGLSLFERDTLLLCASLEFDPDFAALCALAQGNRTKNYPTFSLALSALDDARWDVMSAHRPLRYARFIEISQPGAMPLTSSPLRADERIVNYLKGLNSIDDRIAALLQPSVSLPVPLAGSQSTVAKTIEERLRDSATQSFVPVVQLMGADSGCRLSMAHQVSSDLHRTLYQMAVENLPAQVSEIEVLARLWQRESLLLPVALYIDLEPANGASTDVPVALQRFLSHEMGFVFLGVRETPLRLSTASFTVEVKKPTAQEQCEAWTRFLEAAEPETDSQRTALILAGQFNFSFSDIHEAVSLASTSSASGELDNKIWQACRNLTRPRLDSLAERLDPKATWDDLVLPDEQLALMHQIAGQVRERHKVYEQWGFSQTMNRGFGISALFAGESGTGKTMAAEVIANDLQLNLYRIDLSAVVSKYIGETEKNLRKVFDAAERGGAILLFDEADALFGKRSEVKDSHDRYANIEINYLLQRMEEFSGLAILATNMKSALDTAFIRRLRFIVKFPFPGLKERKQIWEKALPPQTPRRGLDFERLARLNISGGNIHSIALQAAFIAAQNGQTVTMPVLIAAVRSEMRKLEKPVSDAEFRTFEVFT
jgi:SpoVK/Ycf46/Vps4 family AAA+-type ATPase